MNRTSTIISIAAISVIVLLVGILPAFAQQSGPSATRSFDQNTVAPGGRVTVTIAAANYGSIGAVTETLPDGFNYVSSSLGADDVSRPGGQTVRFTLQGADKTFTYTVTASSVAGEHSFSGMLRDSDRGDHDVGGASTVTVEAAQGASQPSAARSFDKNRVAPGGRVTVTIAAADYGSFGAVTETLPGGFSYVSSSLGADDVSRPGGQTVRFTLQGADITFTYIVTASSVAGEHSFSGKLRDSDRGDHDVVGASTVTVTGGGAATTPTPTPTPMPSGACDTGSAVTDKSNTGLVEDCNALLAARDTLRGTAALNWSANTSIARWDGITLEGSPQRVTKVRLHRRGLSGRIPAEIGRLTMLEELWLYVNELTGAIPAELGNLSNLTWLFVSDNNLGGQIPEDLNNLTLDRLWLHQNGFTGCVPYNLTLTREYRVDRGLPACAPPRTTPTPEPTAEPGNIDARLTALESRLADMEKRIASLEATVAGLTGTPVSTPEPTTTPVSTLGPISMPDTFE